MATVFISGSHSDAVGAYVDQPAPYSKKAIFSTNMHLFVFAAAIGYWTGEKLDRSQDKKYEIPERIFSNNHLDGLAYALAIVDQKDGDILRDESDAECWKIFEEYSERGFAEIEKWRLDNPGDIDGVDSLLNRIKEVAAELVKSDKTVDADNVSF